MQPVRPDYDGASVAGLVPALLGGRPAPWIPSCVGGARAVVLFALDGLGWRAIEGHRHEVPTLAGMEGGPITTVVPSTTAAALSSITAGCPPARHGLVGYRIRVGGHVLDVLRWRTPVGAAPTPEEVAPLPPFGGVSVATVTRAEFARTGFTEAHMRGSRFVGWRTTATLVEQVRRLVASGERFVYAYYDGVDKVAHEYGLEDAFFPAELRATDRLIGDLLDVLPEDAAVLVTSDHGQIQFREWVTLETIDSMIAAYGGDGRFRYLYARPGAEGELFKAAEELTGERAWVFERERLFEEGWLGPGAPSAGVASRVGDVVLAARGHAAFADPTHPTELRLVAGHASMTPDEMYVPLLASRGRGGRR